MRHFTQALALAVIALVASTGSLVAQESDAEGESDDAFFDDPFAVGSEDAGAGNDAAFDDFDSLFDDAQMIDTADDDTMAAAPQDDLLTREGVRWGGRIGGRLSADWNWDNVWTQEFDPVEPTSDSFAPGLDAGLFFDARPDNRFRVYGRFGFELTDDGTLDVAGLVDDFAAVNADGEPVIVIPGVGEIPITVGDGAGAGAAPVTEDEGSTGDAPGLALTIEELFADYAWNDALFFRYGKHTIRWGTGFFFSPADVLNLSAVDPENPTADREGPLSLRVLYPFGIGSNAYLYAVTNTGAGLLDVAIAPRIEFTAGSNEISFGGYYQRTLAPRAIALYSGSVGEFDLFGEAVALWGSDRVFVRPAADQSAADADPNDDLNLVLETYTVDDRPFFLATAGARYLKTFENDTSLVLAGQYFFNGEGYKRSEGLLPAAGQLLFNPAVTPALGAGDLTNFGRHYAAATVSLGDLFVEKLGVSLFGLMSLTDLSGIATASISYGFLDRFSLSASGRFTFGPDDGEYTDPGALFTGGDASPTFGVTLALGLPGGSF